MLPAPFMSAEDQALDRMDFDDCVDSGDCDLARSYPGQRKHSSLQVPATLKMSFKPSLGIVTAVNVLRPSHQK
jgi:hypothetical protein